MGLSLLTQLMDFLSLLTRNSSSRPLVLRTYWLFRHRSVRVWQLIVSFPPTLQMHSRKIHFLLEHVRRHVFTPALKYLSCSDSVSSGNSTKSVKIVETFKQWAAKSTEGILVLKIGGRIYHQRDNRPSENQPTLPHYESEAYFLHLMRASSTASRDMLNWKPKNNFCLVSSAQDLWIWQPSLTVRCHPRRKLTAPW